MVKPVMLYDIAPPGFAPRFSVSSLFLDHDGEILLLRRAAHKPQGGTWGVPAGKVEDGETPDAAVLRELAEEAGLVVPLADLVFASQVYVRYPDYDFVYYMYHAR